MSSQSCFKLPLSTEEGRFPAMQLPSQASAPPRERPFPRHLMLEVSLACRRAAGAGEAGVPSLSSNLLCNHSRVETRKSHLVLCQPHAEGQEVLASLSPSCPRVPQGTTAKSERAQCLVTLLGGGAHQQASDSWVLPPFCPGASVGRNSGPFSLAPGSLFW